VDQVLDDPGPGQLLQMQARLAQLDAHALDVPDPETPTNQLVKPYSPHDQLTTRLRTGKFHVLERLGLDQRQCLARLCAIRIEVPVAAEPFTCDRGNRRDGLERLGWADIDLLDIHEPIMAAGAGLAYPITRGRLPADFRRLEADHDAADRQGQRMVLVLDGRLQPHGDSAQAGAKPGGALGHDHGDPAGNPGARMLGALHQELAPVMGDRRAGESPARAADSVRLRRSRNERY
jgi:hypothetical protein